MEEDDETYHEQFHARIFERSKSQNKLRTYEGNHPRFPVLMERLPPNKNAFRTKTKGHADDHQLGSNSGPNSWYVCAQNTTGIFLFTGDVYPLGTYDIIYLDIAVPVARPKHETYKTEIWMFSPCFCHDFTHGKLSSNSFPKRWQQGKPTNAPQKL